MQLLQSWLRRGLLLCFIIIHLVPKMVNLSVQSASCLELASYILRPQDGHIPAVLEPVQDPARPALRLRALESFAFSGPVLPAQVHREGDRDVVAHSPEILPSAYAAYDIPERLKGNVAVAQGIREMFWTP